MKLKEQERSAPDWRYHWNKTKKINNWKKKEENNKSELYILKESSDFLDASHRQIAAANRIIPAQIPTPDWVKAGSVSLM